MAADRGGRTCAPCIADRNGQDPGRLSGDPRPALSRASEGSPQIGVALRLRLATAELELRHRAQPEHAAGRDRRRLSGDAGPVRVGVRTGDTSAYHRRQLRDHPPHVLITTPESLSLLLSQESWHAHWRGVEHIVVDEVHALTPTKRAPTWPFRSSGWRLEPSMTRAGSDCRPPAARPRSWPGFLVGPIANLSHHRGPSAPGAPRSPDRGREPDQARRVAAPRPELPPITPSVAQDHQSKPHHGRFRQHPRIRREDHPRPSSRSARSVAGSLQPRRNGPWWHTIRRSMPGGDARSSRRCGRDKSARS